MLTLGQRLRAARKAKKLSQDKLAKAVGITQSAVSQCERGETLELMPSHLFCAANVLNVNPEWLITGQITVASLGAKLCRLSDTEMVVVHAVVDGLLAAQKMKAQKT